MPTPHATGAAEARLVISETESNETAKAKVNTMGKHILNTPAATGEKPVANTV
jgi:hypothetical protein